MKNLFYLVCILIFSIYLRGYTVSAGLPYFYDEDEAHHFNRTVNMAKSGDLNPHYFHKPSLHFYLRIPVVYLSAAYLKYNGSLNNIQDIRTYNKFGIADYAFTASHPEIVKWNRSLSLAFSLIIIILTFLIAKEITKSSSIGAFSALLTSLSPPLISYSSVIGVDTLMTMMCLFTVYFSILAYKRKNIFYLTLSCIFSGLSVSSKYNALPVVAVPFFSAYLIRGFSLKRFTLCALIPILSFFAASPYILIEMPEFISDLSYEIWHYSTAGHVGHSAEPGLEQFLFYINWFYKDALGSVFSIAALLGFLMLIFSRNSERLLFLSFPILYFLMMVMQKANFVRNMLVILPFLAIMAVIAIWETAKRINIDKERTIVYSVLIFLLGCIEPYVLSEAKKDEVFFRFESRKELSDWIFNHDKSQANTAISGFLQAESRIPLTLKNYTTINEKTETPLSLWLNGYDRLIAGPLDREIYQAKYLSIIKAFPGVSSIERIVENPRIEVYKIENKNFSQEEVMSALTNCADCKLSCQPKDSGYKCSGDASSEGHSWTKKRLTLIDLPGFTKKFQGKNELELTLEIMSPWVNKVGIYPHSENYQELPAPNEWKQYNLKIKKTDLVEGDKLIIYTDKIYSPAKQNGTSDTRIIGLAIR